MSVFDHVSSYKEDEYTCGLDEVSRKAQERRQSRRKKILSSTSCVCTRETSMQELHIVPCHSIIHLVSSQVLLIIFEQRMFDARVHRHQIQFCTSWIVDSNVILMCRTHYNFGAEGEIEQIEREWVKVNAFMALRISLKFDCSSSRFEID